MPNIVKSVLMVVVGLLAILTYEIYAKNKVVARLETTTVLLAKLEGKAEVMNQSMVSLTDRLQDCERSKVIQTKEVVDFYPTKKVLRNNKSDTLEYDAYCLAKVCISENASPLRAVDDGGDCDAIWLTTLNNQWKKESFREALSRMAPHVMGARPPTRVRQEWTNTLPFEGSEMPEGWIQCTGDNKHNCSGNWDIYAENWEKFRDSLIHRYKKGPSKVCDGKPIAWGSEMDRNIAINRKLCMLPCGNQNEFWARQGNGCIADSENKPELVLADNIIEGI